MNNMLRGGALQRLTTRFIALYLLLVLLPSVGFVVIYAGNLRREQQNEQRYKEQLMLNQAVAYFGNSLSQPESVAAALQSDGALVRLLEGGYASASDELMAYITSIQPAFSSVLASYSLIGDVIVYRMGDRRVGNTGLVYNMAGIEDFPYDQRLLQSPQSSFLVADPARARHREGAERNSAQLICLQQIYDRNYSGAVGMLEVQIDMDRALSTLDWDAQPGDLYIESGGVYYPVHTWAGGAHLDWQGALTQLPQMPSGQTVTYELPGWGLRFTHLVPEPAGASASLGKGIALAVLALLVPTSIVCVYIYRYAARMTRFARHIRHGRMGPLQPYQEPAQHGGEWGELVAAYNDMVHKNNQLIGQVRDAEQLTNAATYYAMSSQVNPHFMFNTLENIRMQIEIGHDEDAGRMLFVLGRFLRYNISMRRESTLQQELEHIRHYLMIYHYRMSSRIEYQIDVQPGLDIEHVRCPFCMLQPIVENCLKHGMRDGVAMSIRVTIQGCPGGIRILVADNGSGMSAEEIGALNELLKTTDYRETATDNRVGLSNVNARLKHFFGPRSGLTLRAGQPGGLEIEMRIDQSAQQEGGVEP